MAVSNDGRRFEKLPEWIDTPAGFTQHHRDPKVFRGKDRWWMVVGAQKDNLTGAIALYESSDLIHWSFKSVLYDDDLEQVSECPDLFPLGDVDILFVCPQTRRILEDGKGERVESYAGFVPGTFDEQEGTFLPTGPRQMLDSGFDFYSPQTFVDQEGRRIMTGWMSRMDEDQEAACPTREHGYIHCLTLPRVLSFENGQLYQRPAAELRELRHEQGVYAGPSGSFSVPNGHFELVLVRKNPALPLHLALRNHTIEIDYNPGTHLFRVTRRNWVGDGTQSREIHLSALTDIDIFSDASAAEIFVNDGQTVFSMRYFTDPGNLRIDYDGLAPEERLEYYRL